MSTPDNRISVKNGEKCVCPYCGERFMWPPPKLACPKCGKTVRPPRGYHAFDRSVQKIALKQIRQDDRVGGTGWISPPPGRFFRKPVFTIPILLCFMFIGTALVRISEISGINQKRPKQDKLMLTISDLETYAMALEHYRIDTGEFPSYKDGGLLALISNPGKSGWNGPYIKGICRDGWGRPYFYDRTNGVPILISAGPDRKFKTEDDLTTPRESYVAHRDFVPAAEQTNRPAPPIERLLVNISN